jgi:O-acetyl-ADP-ribose deacetylase (regulator of RNase III)
MNNKILAIQGDLTTLAVDAIVNAANSSLLGGGGVDGAIHRQAGSKLLEECRLLGGCKTGEAKITRGYNLPAQHVIHTVGPIWRGGEHNESELLANCYQNSLHLAVAHNIHSIAFPCISTGVYGFPKQHAAKIAVQTTRTYFVQNVPNIKVIFCCFSTADLVLYQQLIYP